MIKTIKLAGFELRRFKGPLPIISRMAVFGSVCAIRSGMMKQTGVLGLPSAEKSSGKDCLRRMTIVRSSGVSTSMATPPCRR